MKTEGTDNFQYISFSPHFIGEGFERSGHVNDFQRRFVENSLAGGLQYTHFIQFAAWMQCYQYSHIAIDLLTSGLGWIVDVADGFDTPSPGIQIECVLALFG